MHLVLSVNCCVHVCFPIRSPLRAFDVNFHSLYILWGVWLSDIFSGMIFISRIVCFCWKRSRTSIIEIFSICDISNGVSNFHKLGLREIGFNSALLVIHWVFNCVVRDSPKFSRICTFEWDFRPTIFDHFFFKFDSKRWTLHQMAADMEWRLLNDTLMNNENSSTAEHSLKRLTFEWIILSSSCKTSSDESFEIWYE